MSFEDILGRFKYSFLGCIYVYSKWIVFVFVRVNFLFFDSLFYWFEMCTIFFRSPLISLFIEKSVDIRSLNLSLDSIDLEILLSESVSTETFCLLFLNLYYLSCEKSLLNLLYYLGVMSYCKLFEAFNEFWEIFKFLKLD